MSERIRRVFLCHICGNVIRTLVRRTLCRDCRGKVADEWRKS